MLLHVLDTVRRARAARVVAVVGHRAREVRAVLPPWCRPVLQAERLGTGHALACAAAELADFAGPVVVLYADTPLLRVETVKALLARYRQPGVGAVLLSMCLPEGGDYGRIVRDDTGGVAAIVEAVDCTPAQRAITEVNAGMYVFRAPAIFDILGSLQGDNAKGELYLTDAVALLRARGTRVEALPAHDPQEALGVNTLEELAQAEALLASREDSRDHV
jgi:bifunctional N-acetylglucosamine-1-phosphate-uridyltransferase/glucosamine-1-phosphate-acetyltransferase GlmU-like protein